MSKAWPVPPLKPKAPVQRNARQILAVRIDELFSYAPIIPHPDLIEELHNARIAAKRLRYTLELFDFVFGKRGAAAIDQLKELQELLGQIHDLDVRIDLIVAELAALDDANESTATGLARLLDRQRNSRVQVHRLLVQRWNELDAAGFERSLRKLTRST
jgi:CHAD domain-containing protein